ncbi:uncharacterized protein LY79DRAFT_51863 [Colletotrichum navitas]|uniref:Uncharacterized protein n=1 Tax=Colletotrichum navitas TaxID=681940 RepID=A0AAD8V9P1_9PEZI|nr:uncharacterized protein LY79DRAFT_51863 [Colletotrichum navitas]KAK1596720.1 hypothetical protein LY79DRAFT_51863 [Colletotrichum navitas]
MQVGGAFPLAIPPPANNSYLIQAFLLLPVLPFARLPKPHPSLPTCSLFLTSSRHRPSCYTSMESVPATPPMSSPAYRTFFFPLSPASPLWRFSSSRCPSPVPAYAFLYLSQYACHERDATADEFEK